MSESMWNYSLVVLVVCLLGLGLEAKDTSMRVMPNRQNSQETLAKPYVILVSMDGFRYAYLQDLAPRFLRSLDAQHITHAPLIPVFPSITFVNHYSIATGLYPGRHGIVNNFFPDRKTGRRFKMASDSGWYKGMPLWSLAESQGLLSASMFWVGSEAPDLVQPSYFYAYHNEFSPRQKVDKVISWLELPPATRPHFITLYFPEPDGSGHHFGPESKEAAQAVLGIDSALEYLFRRVAALPLQNVNIILVSDHGMLSVDQEHLLELPRLDTSRFELWNSQTMATIYAKDSQPNQATLESLADSLRKQAQGYAVSLRQDLPRYFHYARDPYHRLGDIFLLPRAPRAFNGPRGIHKGKHGYDPRQSPEMLAIFYAYGPAFRKMGLVQAVDNVEIYPIVAQILGLKYQAESIDGLGNVARKILRRNN